MTPNHEMCVTVTPIQLATLQVTHKCVGGRGGIAYEGLDVLNRGGVRPALFINLAA